MSEERITVNETVSNLTANFFKLVNNFFALFKAETKLAFSSLGSLLAFAALLIILLISIWNCLQVALIYLFLSFKFSLLSSILLLMAINLSMFMLCCLWVKHLKNNLFFNATRRQYKKLLGR